MLDNTPCPADREGHLVTEVIRYSSPPPGEAIWASSKTAWPAPQPGSYTVKVEVVRPCIVCGPPKEETS